MQKISTHLWFDNQAKEAAEYYVSIFPEAKINSTRQIHNTPSGSVDIVIIVLAGQEFTLISAGPLFKFNPSISFLVACKTKEEAENLWKKLAGGKVLMELDSYPFSEKYGWLEDKYGLSWQIMFMGDREIRQKITPSLMFVGHVAGRAEEAINFYTSVFRNAKIGGIARYAAGQEPDKEGTITHAAFTIENQEFFAMDSAAPHDFNFNEAISLMVNCADQQEIDYYWDKLSAVPAAEQCGWLKDKFGLSWQIVPIAMEQMFQAGDQKKIDRLTETFLKMKKIDLAVLQKIQDKD